MSRKKKLIWEKDGNKVIVPIKLSKSVDTRSNYSGSLICSDCESKVKQKYICKNCNELKKLQEEARNRKNPSKKKIKQHLRERFKDKSEEELEEMFNTGKWLEIEVNPENTIGNLEKRRTEIGDRELVYENKEKKEFVKEKTGEKLKVKGEIELSRVFPKYAKFLDSGKTYEIFNNEPEYRDFVKKIREYLNLKQVGLFVEFGYYSKNRKGLLVLTDRLEILPLRDHRKIREMKQKEVETEMDKEIEELLKEYGQNENIDLEQEYFKKKLNGKEIKVEKEQVEEEVNTGFLKEEIEKAKKVKV